MRGSRTPPSFPRNRLFQNATPARHRPPKSSFPLSRQCQNCPLSLWERVGVRATPTAQAAIDPLSLWERVGVREPRGKQAGVNGNERERQGYWGPSPGLRPPSPRGRGVGFGTGRTGLRPPSPRGRGVGFGTGRTGLRPPSPRGRGVGFGTGRTGLRPPSPRGRGVGFGTGRTGLRLPSPRGRGVLTQPGKRESRGGGAGNRSSFVGKILHPGQGFRSPSSNGMGLITGFTRSPSFFTVIQLRQFLSSLSG